MEASPLDANRHLRLGVLYLDDAEAAAAVDTLRRAAFLAPRDPFIQFALGQAHGLEGRRARALAAFAHARQLLADVPDETVLSESEGLAAGDLRRALDAELPT